MEIAVNIGGLITIVGFLLFLMRRIDSLRVEIKADMDKMETNMKDMDAGIRSDIERSEAGIRSDMEKMETGIRADMTKMEADLKSEMNLKHGELREDLRDVRVGLMEVREGQARLEGIVEGMGRAAEREAVVSGD